MSFQGWFFCFLSLCCLNSFAQQKDKIIADPFQVSVQADEIKVMTYNVLNLYDTVHDEGKFDYTWLPINFPGKAESCELVKNPWYKKNCLETDWTVEKLELKLNQIKKAIDVQGSLPDILVVQEIENENVSKMLQKKLGYDGFYITNSPDRRGIDVAIFYRTEKLRYIEHEEIDVMPATNYPTRNILRVLFQPLIGSPNKLIEVYGVHWPAQMIRPEQRVKVAELMKKHIDKSVDKYRKQEVNTLIVGDFNSTIKETPNAFHHVLGDPQWSHQFTDAQMISEKFKNPYQFQMPPASYFYGNGWKRLDRILVSKNVIDGQDIDLLFHSYRIIAPQTISRPRDLFKVDTRFYPQTVMVPNRYNFHATTSEEAGFSDHFPVVAVIDLSFEVKKEESED